VSVRPKAAPFISPIPTAYSACPDTTTVPGSIIYYTNAAEYIKQDILNPICYEEHVIQHIPKEMRYRSYGCGSPVLEADIQRGETVVDLGSGTGIECFIASKLTGPQGGVIGIDMGDAMLALANQINVHVMERLQYDNIEFKKPSPG
jgi:SAM-dependent methyltransferase